MLCSQITSNSTLYTSAIYLPYFQRRSDHLLSYMPHNFVHGICYYFQTRSPHVLQYVLYPCKCHKEIPIAKTSFNIKDTLLNWNEWQIRFRLRIAHHTVIKMNHQCSFRKLNKLLRWDKISEYLSSSMCSMPSGLQL